MRVQRSNGLRMNDRAPCRSPTSMPRLDCRPGLRNFVVSGRSAADDVGVGLTLSITLLVPNS